MTDSRNKAKAIAYDAQRARVIAIAGLSLLLLPALLLLLISP